MSQQEPQAEALDRSRLLTVLTQERDFHVVHSGAVTQKVLFSIVTYLGSSAAVVVGFEKTVSGVAAWIVVLLVVLGMAFVIAGLVVHEKKHHEQARDLAKLIAKVWHASSLADSLPTKGDLAGAMDRQPPGRWDTACFCIGVALVASATLVGLFSLVSWVALNTK